MPSLEDSPGFFAAARVELGRKDQKCQTAQALTAPVRVFNNPAVQRRSYRRKSIRLAMSAFTCATSNASVAFYRDILGLRSGATGAREARCFHDRPGPRGGTSRIASCARPQRRGRCSRAAANLLRCATLKDVKDFYKTFVDNHVPINRVVSHGNTVSVYAQDPDGNSVEVYWPSGVDVPQPFGKPMDLSKSEGEIRASAQRHPQRMGTVHAKVNLFSLWAA